MSLSGFDQSLSSCLCVCYRNKGEHSTLCLFVSFPFMSTSSSGLLHYFYYWMLHVKYWHYRGMYIFDSHCSLFRCYNIVWPKEPVGFEMANQNGALHPQMLLILKKQVSGDHSHVMFFFFSLQGNQQYMQQWPWPVHQWWGKTRYYKCLILT